MGKLDEIRGRVGRVPLSPEDAHLVMREHIQSGGRFKQHNVAVAVVRALNSRADITDPEILAKAEAKLFDLLKNDPVEGLQIERA